MVPRFCLSVTLDNLYHRNDDLYVSLKLEVNLYSSFAYYNIDIEVHFE